MESGLKPYNCTPPTTAGSAGIRTSEESQKCWKSSLGSLSPTIHPAVPSPPLHPGPTHARFESLQGAAASQLYFPLLRWGHCSEIPVCRWKNHSQWAQHSHSSQESLNNVDIIYYSVSSSPDRQGRANTATGMFHRN